MGQAFITRRGGGGGKLNYATGTVRTSHYANSSGGCFAEISDLDFAPQAVFVDFASGNNLAGVAFRQENGKKEFIITKYSVNDGGSFITFEVEFLDDGFKFWSSPGSGYTAQTVTYYAC